MNKKPVVAMLIALTLATLASSSPSQAAEQQKEFMLTFDDGPVPRKTEKILRVLDELNRKAAFFMVGDDPVSVEDEGRYYAIYEMGRDKGSIKKYGDLVRKVARAGHYIGNHTMHHAWFALTTSYDSVWQEIAGCQMELKNALTPIGMRTSRLIRPPYFKRNSNFDRVVKELGLTVIMGAGKDQDAAVGDVGIFVSLEGVKERALETLKNHDWSSGKPCVLTFHDISGVTVDHLMEIVIYLRGQGFTDIDFDPDRVKEPALTTQVRSTETTDEKGNFVVGVEAGPVLVKALTPALIGAARQRWRSAFDMTSLLPDTGPPNTQPTDTLDFNQALTQSNAVAACAKEFRSAVADHTTTKAAVTIMKTGEQAYLHDFGICPRFHLNTLDECAAIRVPSTSGEQSPSSPPWFWFSQIYNNQFNSIEVGCQFVVFVNEAKRILTVDSRWVDKQYSPYWRNPQGKQYDYMLNIHVWSYSTDETLRLVQTVLTKLAQTTGNWKVTYANQKEPIQPTVYIEEAWLTPNNTACLSVWNNSTSPTFACFHGTRQFQFMGENDFFPEFWELAYPGRTILQLSIGNINNAVIHCEVGGFTDKIYVSQDKLHPAIPVQGMGNDISRFRREGTEDTAQIKIMWPPSDAKVPVLRDQLDMMDNDDGKRVAIWGIAPGIEDASSIEIQVYTNDWYPHQGKIIIKNGLWGTRAYLSGQGEYNNHSIFVRLRGGGNKEHTSYRADRIQRIDPWKTTIEAPKGKKQIIVEAKDFQIDRGCHKNQDGTIIIGGGPEGPNNIGGVVQCNVQLPDDASLTKLKISLWHGTEQQLGKGIHSINDSGTAELLIDNTPIAKFVCRHRHMFGDFWPDGRPELGHDTKELDTKAQGQRVTVMITTSAGTCMDLRAMIVTLIAQ